jgi:hypothetical protein
VAPGFPYEAVEDRNEDLPPVPERTLSFFESLGEISEDGFVVRMATQIEK